MFNLFRFVRDEGLRVLDVWLMGDTKKVIEYALKILLKLPVGLLDLQVNGNIGKTAKKLTSSQDKVIAHRARKLKEKWLELVKKVGARKRPAPAPPVDEPPPKKQVPPTQTTTPTQVVQPTTTTTAAAPKFSNIFGEMRNTAPAEPLVIMKKKNITGSLIPQELKNKVVRKTRVIGAGEYTNQLRPPMVNENIPPPVKKLTGAPLSADDIKVQKKREQHMEYLRQQKQLSESIEVETPDLPNPSTKKKKSVSWATGKDLVKITPIPRVRNNAISYAEKIAGIGKPVNIQQVIQDKQRQVDNFLRAFRSFEAEIGWYSPIKLTLPPVVLNNQTPKLTQEVIEQRNRENRCPPTVPTEILPLTPIECEKADEYYDDSRIPLMPLEPQVVAPPPEPKPAPPLISNEEIILLTDLLRKSKLDPQIYLGLLQELKHKPTVSVLNQLVSLSQGIRRADFPVDPPHYSPQRRDSRWSHY